MLLSWGTPRGESTSDKEVWGILYDSQAVTAGLGSLLHQTEAQSGIPADLLRAIIFAESGFNPTAKSRKGALGLMQVMPATAREQGYVPSMALEENLAAGASYFESMLDRFNGDIPLALAAYNAGPGAVERYQGIPPYRETQRYVAKVLALYNFFKGNQE